MKGSLIPWFYSLYVSDMQELPCSVPRRSSEALAHRAALHMARFSASRARRSAGDSSFSCPASSSGLCIRSRSWCRRSALAVRTGAAGSGSPGLSLPGRETVTGTLWGPPRLTCPGVAALSTWLGATSTGCRGMGEDTEHREVSRKEFLAGRGLDLEQPAKGRGLKSGPSNPTHSESL